MHRQTWMALALVITGIFIASNLYTMLPLQPQLAEHFGISITTASLASTFFIFPYAVGLFFFGILADQIPHKRLLIFGMISLVVISMLIGFAPNFWIFLAMRAIQGVMAASFAPTAFAYTFEHFQGQQQAFIIAMINTGFLFAGIFGQILSVALTDVGDSYKTVFFGFSLIYFLCFLAMSITLYTSTMKKKKIVFSLSPILSFFQCRPLQKLYAISFFLLMAVMLFYGSFELFMYEASMNLPFSLQTFRFIGLIGIIPAFFAGTLQKQLGPRVVLSVFLMLMALGITIPLFTISIWTLLMASIFLIASTALTIPMVILLIGQFASHARASAVSIYSFTLLTGASIGSIVAAWVPFTIVLAGVALLFASLSLLSLTIQKPSIFIESQQQQKMKQIGGQLRNK
ncbi:MFS transporter [Pontibacillus yanchengensis]|uniref:MFS transporter n=2 Tax=Pontibacillus yanchengensis TaxID=462910 RepID=A0ACC7VFK4_9BACI|nr:MFS transporter [Pontibacillus yanchengensis]MYL32305.1 MFS transporter [Pontibacillus yanchengensis]MYL52885.1 MFS transporter [Pontibacillus yanchengensis]